MYYYMIIIIIIIYNNILGDYGIKDINEFFVYQAACISSYAMHNGYKFKIFNNDDDANYEPSDARWNKGIININIKNNK